MRRRRKRKNPSGNRRRNPGARIANNCEVEGERKQI
jgi:hypothetical protein